MQMKYHFQAFRELIPSQEFFAVMDYHLMLYQATSILLSQHLKVPTKLWHTRCDGWDEIKIPVMNLKPSHSLENKTKWSQGQNQSNLLIKQIIFHYARQFTQILIIKKKEKKGKKKILCRILSFNNYDQDFLCSTMSEIFGYFQMTDR